MFEDYGDDESGAIQEPEYGDLGDDMGDGGFGGSEPRHSRGDGAEVRLPFF